MKISEVQKMKREIHMKKRDRDSDLHHYEYLFGERPRSQPSTILDWASDLKPKPEPTEKQKALKRSMERQGTIGAWILIALIFALALGLGVVVTGSLADGFVAVVCFLIMLGFGAVMAMIGGYRP
jgi:hypothetical protein